MKRVRISTTVDAAIWQESRRLLGLPASKIVDRALKVLLEHLEAERDLAALERLPYEKDPELSWETAAPDLPYEGEIPVAVLKLAKARHSKK